MSNPTERRPGSRQGDVVANRKQRERQERLELIERQIATGELTIRKIEQSDLTLLDRQRERRDRRVVEVAPSDDELDDEVEVA